MKLHIAKKDIVIILAAVLLAAAALGAAAVLSAEPVWVVVYLDGEEYARAPLDENTTVTVEQEDGRVNVIVIEDGAVRMDYSTCKNQICVEHGAIRGDDDTALSHWIICMPNGVSVELTGGGE